MRHLHSRIVRVVPSVIAIACLWMLNAHAGIRLDGTEFQAGSEKTLRSSTTPQDAQATAPGMRLVYTFGQAILAKGEITNAATGEAVKIGLGYDFNALNTTHWGCTCPNQGELSNDNAKDLLEVEAAIQALFFSGSNPQDPLCPLFRLDLNCDGVTDATDLNFMIELIFFNGADPCLPCAN